MSKQTFIYKLIPINTGRVINLNKTDKVVFDEHKSHIESLKSTGVVKWSAQTIGKEFKIVLFESVGEPEAFNIMNSDPLIKYKLMTGSLYPVDMD